VQRDNLQGTLNREAEKMDPRGSKDQMSIVCFHTAPSWKEGGIKHDALEPLMKCVIRFEASTIGAI
jgi:hypothetical protein